MFVFINIFAQYFSLLFWFLGFAFLFRFKRLNDKFSLLGLVLSLVLFGCFHPRMLMVLFLALAFYIHDWRVYLIFIIQFFILAGLNYSVYDELALNMVNFDWFVWFYLLVNPFILLGFFDYLFDFEDFNYDYKRVLFGLTVISLFSHNGRVFPYVLPFICYYGCWYLMRFSRWYRVLFVLFVVVWFGRLYGLMMVNLIAELGSRGFDGSLWLFYLTGG